VTVEAASSCEVDGERDQHGHLAQLAALEVNNSGECSLARAATTFGQSEASQVKGTVTMPTVIPF
jgi:hypothetical protein